MIHKEQERKGKSEEKPVSLSVCLVFFLMKWMCNLLSREIMCKQKSCVCVVVDCKL